MITKINQEIRERHFVIKEKTTFMEREVENNKEFEKKIVLAERQAAKLRQHFQEQEESRTRLHDEVAAPMRCIHTGAHAHERAHTCIQIHKPTNTDPQSSHIHTQIYRHAPHKYIYIATYCLTSTISRHTNGTFKSTIFVL